MSSDKTGAGEFSSMEHSSHLITDLVWVFTVRSFAQGTVILNHVSDKNNELCHTQLCRLYVQVLYVPR